MRLLMPARSQYRSPTPLLQPLLLMWNRHPATRAPGPRCTRSCTSSSQSSDSSPTSFAPADSAIPPLLPCTGVHRHAASKVGTCPPPAAPQPPCCLTIPHAQPGIPTKAPSAFLELAAAPTSPLPRSRTTHSHRRQLLLPHSVTSPRASTDTPPGPLLPPPTRHQQLALSDPRSLAVCSRHFSAPTRDALPRRGEPHWSTNRSQLHA